MGNPPTQRRHHVVQGCGTGRGDQANAARHQGQRAFAGRVEQAFSLQPGLQAQKLFKQSTLAGPLQAFYNELQVAARLVHAQAPAQLDQFTVARHKVEAAGSAAEHGAADLPLRVLDGKVAMPAGCARKARDFPAHRHRVESRLQNISHGAAQRANFPDARRYCVV